MGGEGAITPRDMVVLKGGGKSCWRMDGRCLSWRLSGGTTEDAGNCFPGSLI